MRTYYIALGTLLSAWWRTKWEENPKKRGTICVCYQFYPRDHWVTLAFPGHYWLMPGTIGIITWYNYQ